MDAVMVRPYYNNYMLDNNVIKIFDKFKIICYYLITK